MKASPTSESPFSVDLIENSLKLKWFLQTTHELGVSLKPQSLLSIRRYLDFWLPLVKKHPDLPLIPPVDVAWLWHCHRLAPKSYEEYVIGRFGILLEATTPFALQHAEAGTYSQDSLMTQHLWKREFPDELFFADKNQVGETRPPELLPVSLLAGFDLLGSSERQAGFLWQVSSSSFEDMEFLKQGVLNYWKFLLLKPRAQQQRKILVPTFQIDMMWHTHMLSSIAGYNSDCKALMGSTLHHDDSLDDRTEGAILDLSYQSTKQMWLEEFGTDYVVEGGMYRGEPPVSYYSATWTPTLAPKLVVVEREMGASSTSPNSFSPPSKWATLSGKASDGSPAFIAPNAKTGNRTLLQNEEHKDNYVLGKVNNKVGYYHLETKEAYTIMLSRLQFRIRKLNSDIAMEECCCGQKREEVVKEKRAELQRHMDVYNEISARSRAASPRGVVGRDSNTFTDSTGLWLYPAIVWDSCGGACGGAVACSADVGGASACGGAGGGGCGGGSGGGGCGGGSGGGGGGCGGGGGGGCGGGGGGGG